MILPATAEANQGLCAQCVKIPPVKRDAARAVNAGLDPFDHAIALYFSLIDTLVSESSNRNFGGIADPEFEGLRFYTLDVIGGSFENDAVTELGSTAVDEIEPYLLATKPKYSLLPQMLRKLRTVSPSFNSKGKTIFLGSWGMGPGEIGWLIRYLNDGPAFVRYLHEANITEDEVDAYNDAYMKELSEAGQGVDPNA